MHKLVFIALIVSACLATASAERSEKDAKRIRKDKIHFRRCVIESCPIEYASFRELELAEKEKCYVQCNPSDINTKDKSIKKSERNTIRECLEEADCFDLGIKHFEKDSQFKELKGCADLNCSAIEPKEKAPKPRREKDYWREKDPNEDYWRELRRRDERYSDYWPRSRYEWHGNN